MAIDLPFLGTLFVLAYTEVMTGTAPTDFDGVLTALQKGHRRRALCAVRTLPLPLLDPDPSRQSLLVSAIGHREWPMVHALLDRGVSVNGHDESGETALMAACRAHRPDVVSLLLARGADPAGDRKGHEGVFHAVLGGRSGRLHEVETRYGSAEEVALVEAATLTLFRILLEAGAPANGAPTHTTTPLMQVAHLSMMPLVELLLEHGADVSLANVAGNTAFMFAARDAASHNDPRLLRTLLAAGAEPCVVNQKGEAAADFYEKEADVMVLRKMKPKPWMEFYTGDVLAAQLAACLPESPPEPRLRQRF